MTSESIMLKKRPAHDLEKTIVTSTDIPNNMSEEHLCWNCSNGYPSKCEKVANIVKGTIDTYDFIKSGYQIIKDNNIERFIVTSCLNYEKNVNEQKYSGQEFRKEVGKLFTGYYGTETVRQALQKYDSINRKNIFGKIKTLY